MIWSFSTHRTFRKCPRQWYFKSIFGNGNAKDPERKRAAALGKLESVYAWRGKIVDSTISDLVIPALARRGVCTVDDAVRYARNIFTTQRDGRLATPTNGHGTFFETAYDLPLTGEMFDAVWKDIENSLRNFFDDKKLWELLREGSSFFTQRAISFKIGDYSIRVVPDLIMGRAGGPPIIFDWKVNSYPSRDYWLQLTTGALGLTRCKPHRDWPATLTQYPAQEIQLYEAQLLAKDLRMHLASEQDLSRAEDFIAASATEMSLARGGKKETPTAEDFRIAYEPRTCQQCPFRKLCWEAVA